ncbi:MAG: DUF1848 family protein [Chloroflexi bacterium]|nr:DUF1848 family protein [Chloroflexota bacterium]
MPTNNPPGRLTGVPTQLGLGWSAEETGDSSRADSASVRTPDCIHAQIGRLRAPRPRVISASKRTDIPAFYLPWLIKRCREGWVDVPNPVYRYASDPCLRLTHVSLEPRHVQAIVWWSKNYAHYVDRYAEFAQYRTQYFHFTINSRREDLIWLEPHVPPLEKVFAQVESLARLRGEPRMIAWRYDPICFWTECGKRRSSWDPDFFDHVCRQLTRMEVRICFTSVADRYAKFEQRINRMFPHIALRDPDGPELEAIAGRMVEIATTHGMELLSCTEPGLASRPGFQKGSCIDGPLLGGRSGEATDRKMKGRTECGCTVHTDIGDYVTQECRYSCVYCYANPNSRRFRVQAH